MTCGQCVEKLTDLLNGDLTPDAERDVRAHIDECEQCARAFAQMRGIVVALRGLPEVEPPADLRERLRSIAVQPEPESGSLWRRWRPAAIGLAAAAAALLMVTIGLHGYHQEAGELPERLVMERAATDSPEELSEPALVEADAEPSAEDAAAVSAPEPDAEPSAGAADTPEQPDRGASRGASRRCPPLSRASRTDTCAAMLVW